MALGYGSIIKAPVASQAAAIAAAVVARTIVVFWYCISSTVAAVAAFSVNAVVAIATNAASVRLSWCPPDPSSSS